MNEKTLFEITEDSVEDALEGMLVFHEQLGIGIILRPDRWIEYKHKYTQGKTLVVFIGYSPAVLCENDSLRRVRHNPILWKSLLNEAGLLRGESPEWYAPAGLHQTQAKNLKTVYQQCPVCKGKGHLHVPVEEDQ